MSASGRDREVATEPGSSHPGRDIALAYGGYLCSRQTGATGQKLSFDASPRAAGITLVDSTLE